MSKSTLFKTILLASVAIAGLLASNYYFNSSNNKVIEYHSLLVYPKAKSFSGFKLINQLESEVTIESFSDKWTVLFFGFTNCPDVCPTTLTELQKVFKNLTGKNYDNPPEVLFVSVDSERDTPNILKDYIRFFNPKFNAATGDEANIISLTSQLGVAYLIEDHPLGSKNYNVDHTAALYVISPNKKLYGIFPSPHDANKISYDLSLLLGN